MLVTSEQPGGLTEEGWFHDYSCQYKRHNVGGMHVSILHTRVCAVVCCICVWVCVSVSTVCPCMCARVCICMMRRAVLRCIVGLRFSNHTAVCQACSSSTIRRDLVNLLKLVPQTVWHSLAYWRWLLALFVSLGYWRCCCRCSFRIC